jgi:hypothetical protein
MNRRHLLTRLLLWDGIAADSRCAGFKNASILERRITIDYYHCSAVNSGGKMAIQQQ